MMTCICCLEISITFIESELMVKEGSFVVVVEPHRLFLRAALSSTVSLDGAEEKYCSLITYHMGPVDTAYSAFYT